MVQKLPPPYLEGALNAQHGNTLCIPFEPNRAVNIINSNYKMQARIKTIATNRIVAQLKDGTFAKSEIHPDYDVTFDISSMELTPGQYYKIQLAFDNGLLGYYSTVGVFKYTTEPVITIDKLDQSIGNLYTYTGVYKNEDVTEKVYSYRFYVTQNGTDTLIADSGVLIHDSSNDPVDSSSDTWILNQQLTPGIQYTITYEVTTINGLNASNSYTIVNNEIADDGLLTNCIIEPELDFNNGRIEVNLKTLSPLKGAGGFVLSRADSKDNYETWREVMTFTLQGNSVLPDKLWTDYTVEQGVGYKYGLQRFNDAGFFTKRLINEVPVIADFEDIFLYDGYRQLKVRFNPKVTSFKNTVLETKVDTIGGKYPFIFRNGDVRYKEFPISGLISYLSDPDELFMSDMELGFVEEHAHRHSTDHNETLQSSTRSTQVDTANIAAERSFKMQVLDWLTNGQTKLFRSPSEGNYIVRTMNTSLSPNDTLSRMIHTFSATAYEIAENNFTNLVKYGFIQDVKIDNKIMVHSSLDLNYSSIPYHNLLQNYPNGVYEATFVGVPAGTIFTLQFLNVNGGIDIYIPNNGHYKVNIYDEPLMSVKVKSLPDGLTTLSGLLDISYYTTQGVGDFSDIRKIIITDYSGTYIGDSGRGVIVDAIQKMENIKQKFGYFYSLHIENREIKEIYANNGKYYTSSACDAEVEFNPNYLYYIKNGVEHFQYLDGADTSLTPFNYPNYTMRIKVAGGPVQEVVIGAHNQAGYYTLPSVESIDYLSLGNGLIGTMMCQRKEYVYCIEEDNSEVAEAYNQWKAGTMSDTDYFKLLAEHGIKEE